MVKKLVSLALIMLFALSAMSQSQIKNEKKNNSKLLEEAYGYYSNRQYNKALECYNKLAKKGNEEAMCYLGVMYGKGLGVPKDDNASFKWFKKSAEQGFALSQYAVGNCYKNGNGVSKDYNLAVSWYKKAAEQGIDDAQYELGVCYYNGRGVPKDYIQSVKWFTKSAEQGNISAQRYLALSYYLGNGVTKDVKKAVETYRKVAENGDLDDKIDLGLLCFQAKEYGEALLLLAEAESKGSPRASYLFGMIVEALSGNYKGALEYYTKAHENGYNYATAKIGEYYFKGYSVKQDYKKAFELLSKAANDKKSPSGDAMNLLSSCYRFGLGAEQNLEKAEFWLKKAKENGSDDAKLILQLLDEK